MNPIGFYFDPISPYGYLASTRIDDVAQRHGRSVEWRPLLLGVTVERVMGLKPVPQTPLKGPYSKKDKHRLARLFGVPLVENDVKELSSLNALRAFVCIEQSQPQLAPVFAKAICARLWARGQDISSAADVLEEAARLAIDVDALAPMMNSPAAKDMLRQKVDDAVALGVFGVPSFLVDGELLWGVDRLWMLEHWLAKGNWNPKA